MEPGQTEQQEWTSVDNTVSGAIDVYIPAPIADQVVVAADPATESAAQRALHSLRGHAGLLPLAPSLLRSEGIASSRIEGEVASTRRVFENDYATESVADRQAERIVSSIRVMREVVTGAEHGVTTEDFDRWHALLFVGTPRQFEPGHLRTTQNWIGGRPDRPFEAEFIPPPESLVPAAMHDLAEFVNRVDVAPVTQAAIAHAHFETIHPYPDGNGRVGRALIYRSWAYRGLVADIAPPISQILVERRDDYVASLTAYRHGDIDAWLGFFSDAVESAVSYTLSLGRALATLNAQWTDRLTGSHADALARRIVTDIPAHPIQAASDVAQRHEVTERAARAALEDLAERSIMAHRPLRKAKRGRPAKVYEATELFDLLDRRPQDLA